MNSQDTLNNKIYDGIIDYKHDKACAGLNCKNNNIRLFHMSVTIGSAFLCDDCKSSLEKIGWNLKLIYDMGKMVVEKEDSKRRYETENNATEMKVSKDARCSSRILL